MSKYIDADKLIAFLEKEKAKHIIGGDYSDGVLDACDNILTFISTLQQDLPEVDLEKETEKYFKGWTETDEGIACHYQYVDLNTCRSIARHFYELGKLNARKEE